MNRFGRISIIAVAMLASATLAHAADKKATRADAEALVNRGVVLFQEKGPAEAIRIVNQGAKPFLEGELYLFVIDDKGAIAAHAFDQARVGIAADELYDHEGQPYGKLMLKLANEKGVWIPYRQFNPVSKKVEPKHSFVRKADGYIFGCGVYGE